MDDHLFCSRRRHVLDSGLADLETISQRGNARTSQTHTTGGNKERGLGRPGGQVSLSYAKKCQKYGHQTNRKTT
jgi:hypothetical protein